MLVNIPVSVCCLQIDPEYFKPPFENKQIPWRSNKTTKKDAVGDIIHKKGLANIRCCDGRIPVSLTTVSHHLIVFVSPVDIV